MKKHKKKVNYNLEALSMLKPNYETRNIIIDKDSLKNFHVYEDEKRKTYKSTFNSLLKSLLKGIHFQAALVVNQPNNSIIMNLIDGNHRILVITHIIKYLIPDFKIMVTVHIYHNLDRKHEKKIYNLWNKGKRETGADYITLYSKDIPHISLISERLPVRIYNSSDCLPMLSIVGAHIDAKKQNKFGGGYNSKSGEQAVEDLKKIMPSDVWELEEFFKFMEKVFGPFCKRDPFYKQSAVVTLYRIWFDNHKTIQEDNMIKAFTDILVKQQFKWRDRMRGTNFPARVKLYKEILEDLNSHRKKTYWKVSRAEVVKVPSRRAK